MNQKLSFVKQKIQELEANIQAFKTSQEFLQFLKAMSKFYHYSFYNQMLILSQKPDATRVAGFVTWKKLGRYVKRGEKGIVILVPIKGVREKEQEGDEQVEEEYLWFRSASVFDISQTEGKPLPEIVLDVENKGDAFYHACCELAKQYGITVKSVSGLKAYGVSTGGEVLLRDDNNKTSMATTLVHEIAHELLHQKKEGKPKLDKETKELEAETVAFIVCTHFGIDIPSHQYLATWQENHQVMDSLRQISECSQELIEALEGIVARKSCLVNPSSLPVPPNSRRSQTTSMSL